MTNEQHLTTYHEGLPSISGPDAITNLTIYANTLQKSIVESKKKTLETMIECGHTLTKLRGLIPPGEWFKWCSDNLEIHTKTVTTYIRFAKYETLLNNHGCTSSSHARKILADLNVPRSNDASERKKIARKLRAKGLCYRNIADELGVNYSTVREYFGDVRQQRAAARRKRLGQEEAASTQKIRVETLTKLRRGSSSLSKAYALHRRALQQMHQALLEESDSEARRAIEHAMSRMYRAEDFMSVAARTSVPSLLDEATA